MTFEKIATIRTNNLLISGNCMEDIIEQLIKINSVSFYNDEKEAKERKDWKGQRDVSITGGKTIKYYIQDMLFDRGKPYIGKCWEEEHPGRL